MTGATTAQGRARRLARRRVRPATLTSRGWGVLAAALLCAATGHAFGIGELYAVAAACIAALGWAAVWCRSRRWTIDVGRQVVPGRTEAGRGAVVALSLHNRSWTTSPVLALHDAFDGRRAGAALLVPPLRPGARSSGSYDLAPSGRGVHSIGPLLLEATDPLGLARREQACPTVSTFVVHPRVEHLRAPHVGAASRYRRGTTLPAPGRDNDEFASLREYRPGDDIRRMHWPSTARTGTYLVREDQLEQLGRFTVCLDTRASTWSPAAFERAVSITASIAAAALGGGLQTRLVTTAGEDSTPGAGSAHLLAVLDMLAGVRVADGSVRSGRRGAAGGGGGGSGGGTIAIVSSERNVDDLRRLGDGGPTVEVVNVVVTDTVATPAPPLRHGAPARWLRTGAAGGPPTGATARGPRAVGGRTIRVSTAADLVATWDAAVRSRAT